MGRLIALIMLLTASVLTTATYSWAEEIGASSPTVRLIGPNPLTEHLKSEKGKHDIFTADFNLDIENDGMQYMAAPVSFDNWRSGGYRIIVVSDRNYSGSAKRPRITPRKELVTLGPTTVTEVPVTLTVYDSDTTSLTAVLITSSYGFAPSTLGITLTRSLKSTNFWGIVGGSLAVGAAVLLTIWYPAWAPGCIPAKFRRRRPARVANTNLIFTDATFSFSQSWATSIAAILTVAATVFTTTGVLRDLVPGIDIGFFLAVTIVYGVVLTLAPLVYLGLRVPQGTHNYGRRLGFIIAATITGVAVGGQLSTVGAVVSVSDLPGVVKGVLWSLLFLVAALVVWYTEMTRRQLWSLPQPSASSTQAEAALP